MRSKRLQDIDDEYPTLVCTAESEGFVAHWSWDAEANQWDRFCPDSDLGVQRILFGTLYCLAPISQRPRKVVADRWPARFPLAFRECKSDNDDLRALAGDLRAHCRDLRTAGAVIVDHVLCRDTEIGRVDVMVRDLAAFRAAFADTDAAAFIVAMPDSGDDDD